MSKQPSYIGFDVDTYQWSADIDYRKNPHLYKIGRGQQGVLICQPYKSEIGKHWRFKTPSIALTSATKIYAMFLDYLTMGDFVGCDMAKKYLHMGFTRARRYANHSTGRKWKKSANGWDILPQESDWKTSLKAQSANIFYRHYVLARENKDYLAMKKEFLKNIST